jgi:hypothetical protein
MMGGVVSTAVASCLRLGSSLFGCCFFVRILNKEYTRHTFHYAMNTLMFTGSAL